MECNLTIFTIIQYNLHPENRGINLKLVEPCCWRENYSSWEKHTFFSGYMSAFKGLRRRE